jgi:hypothetical protein
MKSNPLLKWLLIPMLLLVVRDVEIFQEGTKDKWEQPG